ncbi:hypothetical protein [Moorena sp. SIO4A1]|nr:hypothetical protein [Moorena sp. SIO4A1]
MGRWEPTPNPSQEGNGEMGRWGDGSQISFASMPIASMPIAFC